MDINMLEITSKNCYKCDLETIIDDNSQYFWINFRDFEIKRESKWLNIFNKYGNKSTLKYRREITPDIKFHTDRIFVRNDPFEQIIKCCKATNKEFLLITEKLGICLYEENYYTEEIIQIQDNTDVPSIKEISKVSNVKSTKSLTTKLTKEADNKSIKVIDKVLINKLDNKSFNKPDNKSINKTVNSDTTSWYDTDKFNEILATIDNNNFNHENKIGTLKFNDINNLINRIKGNTISEAGNKKKINELNEIKKVETNGKRLIENQKKILSLFGDLETIFNVNVNENENDNENVNGNENENENENENQSENGNEKKRDYRQYYLEKINNSFKEINEAKLFEDQINIFKKTSDLGNYWDI